MRVRTQSFIFSICKKIIRLKVVNQADAGFSHCKAIFSFNKQIAAVVKPYHNNTAHAIYVDEIFWEKIFKAVFAKVFHKLNFNK